jgi:hypothetical protein
MSYPLDHEDTIDRIVVDVDHHSKTHGFQEEWELADILDQLGDRMMHVQAHIGSSEVRIGPILRDAAKALRVNFLGMKIALMHSELSEALERLREVGVDEVVAGDEHFIEELADSTIRVMETSAILGKASLGKILIGKIKRNRARPYRHGKAH